MTNTKFEKLTPAYIQQLVPYQSARRLGGNGDVWLNANEMYDLTNYTFTFDKLNRYPEEQPTELQEAYAKYAQVSPAQLLITRGADEGIDLIIRAFCTPNQDKIMFFPPTYGMYKVCAQSMGIQTVELALTESFQLPLTQIADNLDNVKLIYICTPNNPTGSLIDTADLEQLFKIVDDRAIIVLDQAYVEFYPQAILTNLLAKYDNLILLRTLSKSFALAGLRCGFLLANPAIINIIRKIIAPYPIPTVVSTIATTFLTEPMLAQMRTNVAKVNSYKSKLVQALQQMDFVIQIYPSVTNFILIKVKDKLKLINYLAEQKIIIRDQSSQLNLANCVRITVGSAAENTILLNTLNQFNQ